LFLVSPELDYHFRGTSMQTINGKSSQWKFTVFELK
jgi:hypothetical protein